MTYHDGVNKARGDLKDSYGNPVQYDTIEDIDNKKPSKQSDPNLFVIPGYASGILNPHEVPTRSNSNGDSRKLDDGRIHFVDPLQNSFQDAGRPQGINFNNANNQQTPINIPRPNIDLNETPQAPIDDPLNHPLTPPTRGIPSSALEVPTGNSQQFQLTQDLIPPQIPSNSPGVFIPRPNIDASETPTDNNNGPLNQGLLPPVGPQQSLNNVPVFTNSPSQNGPVIITEGEVVFAPKPSNGLLPPKDPSPNDISYQPQELPSTTASTINRFGGSSGVLNSGILGQGVRDAISNVRNKVTGTFGGSPGILGGRPVSTQQPNQIPVQVLQSPFPSNKPVQESSPAFTKPSKEVTHKYSGNFGGPPGVLTVQDSQLENVSPSQNVPSFAPNSASGNKFTGSFGGAQGVLGDDKITPSSQSASTQTLTQLPNLNIDSSSSKDNTRYNGQFGGSPGILTPFDNAN